MRTQTRWLTAFGLLAALTGGQAVAATQYTYDELNRLTKVVYDDGRSISYAYDAAGNLLRVDKLGPTISPDLQLRDNFDGASLDAAVWNARGGASCGGMVVGGGQVRFNGGTYADTQGKKAFAADRIVVQAVMAGTGSNRDTHFELIDTINGDLIQVGDTTYFGRGLYLNGTGRYASLRTGIQPTTSAFKAYRLTVEGAQATIERAESVDGPWSGTTVTLPASTAGRSFYLRIGTGAPDCIYSPGTFESIQVTTPSRLTEALVDDFEGTSLDPAKWISAGYNYEPALSGTGTVGPVTVAGGVMEFGSAGGVATIGKQHFKGRKIVVEARVARTGGGEFPMMLVSLANLSDRFLMSDTPYIGAGFLGVGDGRFKLAEYSSPSCVGPAGGIVLGSPPAAGVWMEYRMTVEDGTRFKIERGPTLAAITQSATATLCNSIEPYEFFLYLRTGSSGGYFGARFDWVRVNVTP